MAIKLTETISTFDRKDLKNLVAILDPDGRLTANFQGELSEKALEAFRWCYHSQARAKALRTVGKLFNEKTDLVDKKKRYPLPFYDELLVQASKKTKCYTKEASIDETESYLVEGALLKVLTAMKPPERHRVFSETFQMEEVAREANIKDNKYAGPITAFGALGMAQASGFGVFLAATTTLGFLTHAVGVTLPFAAYTGLTSTIAVIIGPVGWLGAGIWTAFAVTGTKWDRIIPALIYIIQVRHRPK